MTCVKMSAHNRAVDAHRQALVGETVDPTQLLAAILEEVDPLRLMGRVADAVLTLVDTAEGSIVELRDADQMVYVCGSGDLKQFEGLRIPLEGSLAGLAMATREPLMCADSETDPRVDREACRRVKARSLVCVPLRRGDAVIGVLKVASSRPNAFSQDNVSLLQGLSDFVAAVIGAADDLARTSSALLGHSDRRAAAADESFATFVAQVLRPGIADELASRTRIGRVLVEQGYDTVFQPIVDVERGVVVGLEALTRFHAPPTRAPDLWFDEAHRVGRGVELELAAAERALTYLKDVGRDLYVSINASPALLATDDVTRLMSRHDLGRIVIELTEHIAVQDYPELLKRLTCLRRQGARLAIDDAGAGVSSMAHVLALKPDIIKLDRSLTSRLDRDPVRRSLATALVAFGRELNATVVAEGVETAAELSTLRSLGVAFAQGYFLGRPAPLPQLEGLLHDVVGQASAWRAGRAARPRLTSARPVSTQTL